MGNNQSINTVVDNPDDYKAAEGIVVASVNEGKKDARIGIEVVYRSEEAEEDLIEKDSDDVMPIHIQKGTKGKAR